MSAAMLHYTPELHQALRDVADRLVVQCRWYGGGFEWAGGGQMTQAEQDNIHILVEHGAAVLSQQGVPCLPRPVIDTADGIQVDAAWSALAAKAAS